jgi:hypothetical protein
MVGILQDFTGFLPATNGLIVVPWTSLASLCFRRLKEKKERHNSSGPLTTPATALESYSGQLQDVAVGFEKRL